MSAHAANSVSTGLSASKRSGQSAATEAAVFRPHKSRIVAFSAAAVLLVVFSVIGALLRNTPTGAYFRVSDQVAMVVLGVLLAGGSLLLTLPRVRADEQGIEVRTIMSTRRYSWSLVQAISFPPSAPWARLELPEDEYVPLLALQASDGQRTVEAMRTLRHLRRSAAQASGSPAADVQPENSAQTDEPDEANPGGTP